MRQAPPNNRAADDTTRLCGLPLARVTMVQAVALLSARLEAGAGAWVLTVNLDILRRWARAAEFRALTEPVDLCVADGMPLVWASRLAGRPLPERVAGSDLVVRLSAAAADYGFSVYLLGGAPGAALRAADVLAARCPGLRVAGTACPAPGFERSPQRLDAIRAALRAARPAIVYVALGSPKQERLIARLRGEFPDTCWIGVGAAFDFLAGNARRAPIWLQRAGLEWLYRLVQEPRRLARRYLLHDLPFVARLAASALRERAARR